MIAARRSRLITNVTPSDSLGNYCCGTKRGYAVWSTGRIDILVCCACHATHGVRPEGLFGVVPIFGDTEMPS